MKTWTVKQMLAEKPCEQYTEEVLTKLWAGCEKVSWLDIEKMDILDADKMWGAWKGLTKKQTDLVLEKVVTRAITNHALHCGVPAVEKWAGNWLSGEDRSARAAKAAASAAWAAKAEEAEATAWAAASAAWAAKAEEAEATAWWAAASAAWAAKAEEAEATAWAAELKLQVADVLSVLTAQKEGEGV
jgi:hypothetical protein